MAQEENPDLEAFRKQWQEEVSARANASSSSSSNNNPATLSDLPLRWTGNSFSSLPRGHSILRKATYIEELTDGPDPAVDHLIEQNLIEQKDTKQYSGEALKVIHQEKENKKEPSSALEHYEQAVERESQGNLGDSLKHYRKAFRVRSFL